MQVGNSGKRHGNVRIGAGNGIESCFYAFRDVYREYIPCPFTEFEPIQNFTGSWADYIDWHAVHEFLWRLDFRRKFVKLVNSREGWRASFKRDWRNILHFDTFYCFLLYSRVPCFKPMCSRGFNSLQGYRSPFVSARWWIED